MPTVRVRMFEQPIEVDEAEVGSLRRQGLLVEELTPEKQRARLVEQREAAVAEVARLDGEIAALAPEPKAKTTPKKES